VSPVNLVLGDLKVAENLGQGFLFLKNLILTCFLSKTFRKHLIHHDKPIYELKLLK
jgi:hypothetical protein